MQSLHNIRQIFPHAVILFKFQTSYNEAIDKKGFQREFIQEGFSCSTGILIMKKENM